MTFAVTIYANHWNGGSTPIPAHYLGERRFIDAPTSMDASRIASERFPQAWRIRLTPIPDPDPRGAVSC